MNNNHISLHVEMSDEDKLLEQVLINEMIELGNKIDIAIAQGKPLCDLTNKKSEIRQRIIELKGTADIGQRLPKNSTELAQALIIKLDKVKKLEGEYLNNFILDLRSKQENNKDRILQIIEYCKREKLDKRFQDIGYTIDFWNESRILVFDKKGEELGSAWAYQNGVKPLIAMGYNLLTHLIIEIMQLESKIDEIEHRKKFDNQVTHLESCARIVASAQNDNDVFQEIFLMGQYTSNLNSIELNINTLNDKKRSRQGGISKAAWADELAQVVYLDFWIKGEVPTVNEVQGNKTFSHLVQNRSTKTISDQLTKQRKSYSKIDKRVPPVKSKGRNKKI